MPLPEADDTYRTTADSIKAQQAKDMENRPMRELTVGELLDRRIDKAMRLTKALQDLKGSLPGSYLQSGASRISAFLEI